MKRPLAPAAAVALVLLPGLVATLALASPASADQGRARIALVTVGYVEGVDPRLATAVEIELRGVAAEQDVGLIMVSLAQQGFANQECDATCLASLAEPLDADFVLSGALYRSGGGFELLLDLQRAGMAEPVDGIAVTAADDQGLLDAVAREGARLFGSIRDAGAATHGEPELAPSPRVNARPGLRPGAAAYDPRYEVKSPGVALAMELLLPGLGLIYTESYLEAGLEWGGMLLGLAIIVGSIDSYDEVDDTQMVLGVMLLLGARVYGIIAAPANASAYNRRAYQEAMEARPRAGSWTPPRSRELGETIWTPPRATLLALPAVTF